MEHIILGLLLLKPMTAYEISRFTNKNFSLICSGSAGSVQIALKKLLKNNSVTVSEFVQGGINKRVYKITALGKSAFEQWVTSPMQAGKAKNIELSKLFFLGFADKESRLSAVDDYIGQLKKVKKALIAIRELSLPKNASQLALLPLPNAQDILTFQTATLDFGIDSADFEINWYKKLRLKMESES